VEAKLNEFSGNLFRTFAQQTLNSDNKDDPRRLAPDVSVPETNMAQGSRPGNHLSENLQQGTEAMLVKQDLGG